MPDLRGMVLAAGHGTRLAPVTDYVAKPLLPYLGRTLLDRACDALLAAGCGRVVVNAHHRAHQVAGHVDARDDRDRLRVSLEPEILGTAGALDGAREYLEGAATIVVYNGDVICDRPLAGLVQDHRASGALATLLLVDRPEINTVLLGAGNRVRDLAGRLGVTGAADDRRLTFTGIACYDGAILERVPAGRCELVTVLARVIAARPDAVRGHVHDGQWDDLGTLPRYLAAHRRVLGPGFRSVGRDARVPDDAVLDECVVLPSGWVPAGATLRRAVVGSGWVVSADPGDDPALGLAAAAGFTASTALEWITGHGSDRRFFRLREADRRAVMMTAPPGDADHDRTVRIASFLYELGLGAPAVLAQDARRRAIVFEDLGHDTLGGLVASAPDGAAALYDRVLDRLADLQTFGTESRHRCPPAWDRAFDREHLRWETDYFRQRFLIELAGVDPTEADTLDEEFEALATACLAQPRTLVHRDFQSQNILVKDGVVRVVDVQGMRWGPIAYDVMALLYDPYVDLAIVDRDALVAAFPARRAARGADPVPEEDWRHMTNAAGLQRLMQALGAFAFLGRVKKRPGFLEHVPAALSLLGLLCDRAATGAASPFAPPAMPRLRILVERVRSSGVGF